MKILAIDCATEHVSAALWLDGEYVERTAPPRRGLSESLLDWCAQLLAEAAMPLRAVDLIAFGRGPGAFTGVRMATSLAQGLAWSIDRPVAAVSTLRAIAHRALELPPYAARALVCQDARMGEVYWALAERRGADTRLCGAERLAAPDAVVMPAAAAAVQIGACDCVATGTGFNGYPALLHRWRESVPAAGPEAVPRECAPRARDIAQLAALDGLAAAVSPADAAPVYLRDNVATPPVPRPAGQAV